MSDSRLPIYKLATSLVVVLVLVVTAACGESDDDDSDAGSASSPEPTTELVSETSGCHEDPVTTESGLEFVDLECGDGDEAESGMLVTVHYVGTLEDGTKFDSSRDRGEPFPVPLGAGGVIPGWDEGVEGMKVGGIRKLTIPPDLGYGEAGAGG
ncbi:MAG TPA: FKBP-type peptidyl-prolyl cis-trans isomerase, partial [Actinomycetota bacterium]|nr:FKBP-type peptidyl-prolyl cis-trans isomerase [Actinomycetota bacterium]